MFAAKDRKQQPSSLVSASKSRDQAPSDLQKQPLDSLQMLQRSLGNHYLQALSLTEGQPDGLFMRREDERRMLLQPELVVGAANDIYEQEADRVAEQVMGMPEPKIQRVCPECEDELQRQPMEEEEKKEEEETLQTKPLAESITPLIQRQTELTEEEEKKKEEEETLQTKTASGEPPTVSPDLQNRITALRGGGQPLPQSERNFFEPRFGADFSQVRIHADTQAAETASAVNARAFTLGRDVVFGAGQYQPRSSERRRLLAHELTHVVQQGGSARNNLIQRQDAGLGKTQQPSSLNQTLDARLLSAEELEQEIYLICKWLKENRDHPESYRLRIVLKQLEYEYDLLLSQRTPGLLSVFMPAHTKPYYRDPSYRIHDPYLRFTSRANTEAFFGAATLGRNVLAASAAAQMLAYLAIFGFVEIGGAIPISSASSGFVSVVGSKLSLIGGLLKTIGTSALSFYLYNPVLVFHLLSFTVELIISVEGDVIGLLKALKDNHKEAVIILAQIWIIHASVQTPRGERNNVRTSARPLPANQQTDPRRLKLEIIDVQSEVSPTPVATASRPGKTPAIPEVPKGEVPPEPVSPMPRGGRGAIPTSEEIEEVRQQEIGEREQQITGGGRRDFPVGEGDPTTQIRTHSKSGKPPSPSPGPQPRPFQRGNFVHRFAEYILRRRLPPKSEAEVTIQVDSVTRDTIRLDRFVRGQGTQPGEVIEIRPTGRHAEMMKKIIHQRVQAVEREIPSSSGYRGRVVEYTVQDVLDYLIQEEGMSLENAQSLLREYGFNL